MKLFLKAQQKYAIMYPNFSSQKPPKIAQTQNKGKMFPCIREIRWPIWEIVGDLASVRGHTG